jgi:uncharacterized protein (TIGR02271 family)
MADVVVGVFEDRSAAQQAVNDLKNAGFNDNQIGFAMRDDTGANANMTDGGEQAADTAGGAVSGALGGGILGGILGAAASLLIPGIGPVVAGGILAATLGGAAIGAAAGGLLGALTGMGVPEDEARYYEGEFNAGRTIVTVQAGNRQREALDILRRNGAYDAGTRQAMATGGYDNTTNTNVGRTQMTKESNQYNEDLDNEQGRKVQLREEQLQATKQPVQAGEVRIGKEVVTEEKTINVPVQREQVYVEQRNVAPRPTDQPIGDDGEVIRVPVIEEQVQVQKQAVVTGEVLIGKQTTQENQQVSDTVRREEARIEQEGDVNIQGEDMQSYNRNQNPG